MNTADIDALVKAHSWAAIAAIVIGLVVRAMRADTLPVRLKIAPKWRPWIALVLGQVSAALNAAAGGATWKDAVAGGLISTAIALVAAGAEPTPPAAGGTSAAPPKPGDTGSLNVVKRERLAEIRGDLRRTLAFAIAMVALTVAGLFALCSVSACHLTPAQQATVKVIETDAKIVLTDADQICVFEHMVLGELEPAAIATACKIIEKVTAVDRLLANQRAGALLAMRVKEQGVR